MADERFDVVQVMRGDEDRRIRGPSENAADEFIANQRVESGERLVENQQARTVSERARERRFHPHAV